MKAADALSIAQEHHKMAESYRGWPGQRKQMNEHGERIADLNEELATQYEEMAKGEESAAKM